MGVAVGDAEASSFLLLMASARLIEPSARARWTWPGLLRCPRAASGRRRKGGWRAGGREPGCNRLGSAAKHKAGLATDRQRRGGGRR